MSIIVFQVVDDAKQVPLGVHLLPAPQGETVKAHDPANVGDKQVVLHQRPHLSHLSLKGAGAGLMAALVFLWFFFSSRPEAPGNGLAGLAWLLLIPALASFLGMEFTGASTYTSLSGVKKEMRLAVPLQIAAALCGLLLLLLTGRL